MTKAQTTALVKRILGQKSETKVVSYPVETNVNHNSAISGADMVRVLPATQQGTDDWQRIGESIRPKSLVVRGLIAADRIACTTNQVLLVRIVIAQAKEAKFYSVLATIAPTLATQFIKPNQEAAGASTTFQGLQQDLFSPVNPDLFTVYYDKIHRLAPSAYDNAKEQNEQNYFRFAVRIPTPATLDYESLGQFPRNFAPFFALGYAYADGQGPDVTNLKVVSNVRSILKFKDY